MLNGKVNHCPTPPSEGTTIKKKKMGFNFLDYFPIQYTHTFTCMYMCRWCASFTLKL